MTQRPDLSISMYNNNSLGRDGINPINRLNRVCDKRGCIDCDLGRTVPCGYPVCQVNYLVVKTQLAKLNMSISAC
jgi:hypothetical protein